MSLDLWDVVSKYVWFFFSFCSALQLVANLLFSLYSQSFCQLLALGSLVASVTIHQWWSSVRMSVRIVQKWVLAWPSLFTAASSRVGYFISLNFNFLIWKISKTINIIGLLSQLWLLHYYRVAIMLTRWVNG